MRLPEPLQRATFIAVELGMDDSITAATSHALLDRVTAFARGRALAAHFERFPEDVPPLAEVAARRVSGSDHAAARRPELLGAAADAVERRRPEWATTGDVDDTVDEVLTVVEAMEAVAPRRTRPPSRTA